MTSAIKDALLTAIADQMIASGVAVWDANIVRGVYNSELQQFAKSIYGQLKTSDPAAYALKEMDFLESKIKDKDSHLKACLEHVVKSHKKQVVIFMDNVDQRGPKDQADAFLIAQEIAQHWPAMVFLSLRPETFHEALKDTKSGYHPKAFTILPPRVDRVVEQRLTFARKITKGEIPIPGLTINIHLQSLDKIISAFLDSLKSSDHLHECLDNMSGGNVRIALDYVRWFFGSGHVDTKKICDKVDAGRGYTVRVFEFLKSVAYGDYAHYSPKDSPLANLFDLSFPDAREHFLLPILLGTINALGQKAEEGFVETSKVIEAMQEAGFTPQQIDAGIYRASDKQLIEPHGRRQPIPGEYMPVSVRITPLGNYHAFRLAGMFTYVDAVIVDTPILDQNCRPKIHNVMNILLRLDRADLFRNYLDEQWAKVQIPAGRYDWPELSAKLAQDIVEVRNRVVATGATGASY